MAKQLVSEPYQDWKDLLEDIKNHAFTEYHLSTMAQLNELMRAMSNPEKGIGAIILEKNKEKFEKNKEFSHLLLNAWRFFGRQGIGLRDH